MKKATQRLLGLALGLVMLLGLTACGGGGGGGGEAVTTLGTYQYSELIMSTITQGKLAQGMFCSITIFSDGGYVLSTTANAYYSSDGGETYTPNMNVHGIVYGKYEMISDDEELGEKQIKITSVDRILYGNIDTDKSQLSDGIKDTFLTNNQAVGTEVYLSTNGELSDNIPINLYGIDGEG